MSTIIEKLDRFVSAFSEIKPFLGSPSGEAMDEKSFNHQEIEEVLRWFLDGGIFSSRLNTSIVRGGSPYYMYTLTKSCLRMYVGSERIEAKRKPSRGVSGLASLVADCIISQCQSERIAKQRASGREYFYDDNSLLKRVRELFGEPKEEK